MSNLKKIRKQIARSQKPSGPKLTPEQIHGMLQDALRQHQAGNLPAAEQLYNQILASVPHHADCLNFLGVLKAQSGKHRVAETCFQKAIASDPSNQTYYNNLGNILKKQDQMEAAADCYRKALAIKPDYADALNNLGNTLKALDETDEAISCFEKVLQIEPDYAEAHKHLGTVLATAGRFDEAITSYERAFELSPGLTEALACITGCRKYRSAENSDTDRIIAALERPVIDDKTTFPLRYALGKIYDDCGLYDQAFEQYRIANNLKHEIFHLDMEVFRKYIDQIIGVFQPELLAKATGSGSESELPVFIVGMPRSGSTMVERILSSHPLAYGAGEMKLISKLALGIPVGPKKLPPYPGGIKKLTGKEINNLANKYENHIRHLAAPGIERVIDKQLYNYEYLGLISMMFPRARFIYCRRSPLDTCLSNYFQNFSEGNNQANSLEELGFYYRQVERLMQHWQTVLPAKILTIQYEELIASPEKWARALISFIGLEWDNNCLAFHRQAKAIRTASGWQARQPIYTTSVARWKHYEKFLDPLFKSLGIDKTTLAADGGTQA